MESLNVLILLLLSLWLINPLGENPTLSTMGEIDGLSVAEREMLDLEKEKPAISDEVKSKVAETLQGFAGGFLRNTGQKSEDIYFYVQSSTIAAGFGTSEVRFSIANSINSGLKITEDGVESPALNEGAYTTIMVKFPGSNEVSPIAEEPTGGYNNYYRGGNKETWSEYNPYYKKLVYYRIYEKIDLVYELQDNHLKYEFIVHPGGNPAAIKLHWTGPVSLELKTNGIEVKMQRTGTTSTSGDLIDTNPIAYQSITRENPFVAEFELLDATTYGFSVPSYDPGKILIIDPLLKPVVQPDYSMYFGGSGLDYAKAIAIDNLRNVYVTGYTTSTDFPAMNAYNATGDGNPSKYDAFVFKLAPDGRSLLYSTYIAGSEDDQGYGIAVDSTGNAFVTGYTKSTDFPTMSAYNNTSDGNTLYGDAFVVKLAADGRSLVYSTYVGGNLHDEGYRITVDNAGNAFVTGFTYSANFPTVNAYNATGDGNPSKYDAFVFKLAADGQSLLYSTYVAGSDDDVAKGIAVDDAGNAFVTGTTFSTDFPTVSAYDTTGDGNPSEYDAFVFKLAADGQSLLYSTYVAGSDDDMANGIAIDDAGNAFVMGATFSVDFPTVNAYDAIGDGNTTTWDTVVFKLAADGQNLLYSTYVGGSHDDFGYAIAIDNMGSAYVTGYTQSIDFPPVNAYNTTGDRNTAYQDVFVFKLAADGGSLLYSTYISGSHHDYANGIAVDSVGNVYIAGHTQSADFPALNAYNTTGYGYSGSLDAFVCKLNRAPESVIVDYCTYISGSGYDQGFGIAVDSAGNIYVTGGTSSTDFPTTPNAYNTTRAGGRDVFVLKLAADASTLVYSTYVGGSVDDEGFEIGLDSSGNVYVMGYSESDDFPTTPTAYNATGDGSLLRRDVIVFKLASDGGTLLYSTYVGGSLDDYGTGLAIDEAGNAYVTGSTYSTDFPTTPTAYNTTGDGAIGFTNAFVFKLAANGSNLLYSTYVWGTGQDLANGIAIDSSGNAYVVGHTTSDDFPMVNAYNATKGGETLGYDVFVFKLAADGRSLRYSTYVGGNESDYGEGIAVDNTGVAYILAGTLSPNFPTLNAYQPTKASASGIKDMALFKLAQNGNSLLYSSYIGGSNHDSGTAIAADNMGNVFVTGYTQSPDFPTLNAYDANGDRNPTYPDAIIFKLAADGSRFLYSTYVAGSLEDYGIGMAVTSAGTVYIVGHTKSPDFPAVNALNATGDGNPTYSDAFVLKMTHYSPPTPPTRLMATLTANDQVLLTWSSPFDEGNSPVISYRVYRSTNSGFYGSFLAETTSEEFIDTTVVSGVTYYYIVTAVNLLGESMASYEISALLPSPLTHPSSPLNLSATLGSNFIELNWTPPSNDGGTAITGYRVYRGTSSGIYMLTGILSGTSFNDTTVVEGTTYYYVVAAINGIGESDFSNEVSATPTGVPTPIPAAPGIPQSVSATASENSVLLSWTAPLDDGGVAITSYRVYRGTSSGVYALIGVLTTGTSYEDAMVAKGTTYYYVITAVNGVGESAFSIEVSAVITLVTSDLPKTSKSEDGAAPGFLMILLCLGVLVVLGRKRKPG